MVVSLGPTSMSPYRGLNITKNPRADGTGYNPRCLRRDVNRNAAMGATADRAYSLIANNSDIDGFYNQLLGNPPPKNDPYPWGVRQSLLLSCGFQDMSNVSHRSTRPGITSTRSTPAATRPRPPATRSSTSTTARSTGCGGSGRCRTRTRG